MNWHIPRNHPSGERAQALDLVDSTSELNKAFDTIKMQRTDIRIALAVFDGGQCDDRIQSLVLQRGSRVGDFLSDERDGVGHQDLRIGEPLLGSQINVK